MSSTDRHPEVVALQTEPLVSEARQYIESGERPRGDTLLARFIAVLSMLPTCERPVESLHSLVHRWYLYACNRTLAYDSLKLRMPEIVAFLEEDPEHVTAFAALVYKCRRLPRGAHQHLINAFKALALER